MVVIGIKKRKKTGTHSRTVVNATTVTEIIRAIMQAVITNPQVGVMTIVTKGTAAIGGTKTRTRIGGGQIRLSLQETMATVETTVK